MHNKINGEVWSDTKGVPINVHAGGIIWYKDRYYWYGEHKGDGWNGRLCYDGVRCYSSKNLKEWTNEGLVLKAVDDIKSPIVKGCRIERPKVLYCSKTKKFVMWWHSTDANHMIAKSGVAVSSSPIGPFNFVRAFRPDAGVWPLNVTLEDQNVESIENAKKEGEHFANDENDRVKQYNILGRDFDNGQMARDQTLFQDDDGVAYHIFASEHNSTLHLARLTEDYLDHSGEYIRFFVNRWHEAPALFKRNKKYYLLTSGCTSWDPNPARASVADSIYGPWKERGNPCRGINSKNGHGPETTFNSQSAFVFKIHNKDQYIAVFDVWNPKDFIDSRYIWLPIEFDTNGYSTPWRDS